MLRKNMVMPSFQRIFFSLYDKILHRISCNFLDYDI